MRTFIKHSRFISTITFVLAFTFFSCKKESNLVAPPDSRPVLDIQHYSKVVLNMAGYDTVRVTHQIGLDLRTPNITRIGFGTKESTGYMQSLLSATTYDPNAQMYVVHFDFLVRLDSSKAIVPFTIRYYFADSSYLDVDTTVLAFRYPYPSAEIIVQFSSLQSSLQTAHPEDVDRIGSSVFFHPTAAFGLYRYDLNTRQASELLTYNGGDFIAADSVFVFCDVYHHEIQRYNLTLNAVDLTFPTRFNIIRGMDVYNGSLYVADAFEIMIYSFDGVLLDSVNLALYGLTIGDSIIYESGWPTISLFDLRTRQFLLNVLSTMWIPEGIKEYHGKLYYCDFEKRIIGAVPVADLRTVP